MEYLKPKIMESFKKRDYDSLITQIKQYEALKYYVGATSPLRESLKK